VSKWMAFFSPWHCGDIPLSTPPINSLNFQTHFGTMLIHSSHSCQIYSFSLNFAVINVYPNCLLRLSMYVCVCVCASDIDYVTLFSPLFFLHPHFSPLVMPNKAQSIFSTSTLWPNFQI
jgi:hypothetical protein